MIEAKGQSATERTTGESSLVPSDLYLVDTLCQKFENSCSSPVEKCYDQGIELLELVQSHEDEINDESYDDVVLELETLVNSNIQISEEDDICDTFEGTKIAKQIERSVSRIRSLYLRSFYFQDRNTRS